MGLGKEFDKSPQIVEADGDPFAPSFLPLHNGILNYGS